MSRNRPGMRRIERIAGRRRGRRAACVLLALLVPGAVVLSGPAALGASKPPKRGAVKTRIAKLRADVIGYIEIVRRHDTTSDCYPGERWTQTSRYDFETGRPVNVSLKRVSAEGVPTVVTSRFTAPVGVAVDAGTITDYATTNFCDPDLPKGEVLPPPACKENRGRVSISLQEGLTPTSSDPELTPLNAAPMLIAVSRIGGGMQDPTCLGGGVEEPVGDGLDRTLFATSQAPGIPSIIFPTGYDGIKVFNLRPGRRLVRTLELTGSCQRPNLLSLPFAYMESPPPVHPLADGDCLVRGKIFAVISPRPRSKS